MITFLGDVALIKEGLKSEYKLENPFIINCEYVIGDSSKLTPTRGKVNLVGDQCDFQSVFGCTPIAATVGNNHIYDYGEKGYDSTVKALEAQGIEVISDKTVVINGISLQSYMYLNGKNYGSEPFFFNEGIAEKRIDEAKKNNLPVVIIMHWGIENHPMASQEQKSIAHTLINMGADMIIGHHPHCIQNVEIYKGKYIFYSLGNGLFPNFNVESHFDETGKPTRKYRNKWQKWNNESLAVTIDNTLAVVKVDLLYMKRNTLVCLKKDYDLNKLKYRDEFSNLKYRIRKYFLFFASNMFVDGKLIDIKAFFAELRK